MPVQAPDLLEELASVTGVRRQQGALPQEFTTLRPEAIADLVVMQRVLRQGGVNSILKLSALPDEHHPGARQITLVPECARRNPYGRERAVPCRQLSRVRRRSAFIPSTGFHRMMRYLEVDFAGVGLAA
jgi:hypothetical protein